MSEELRDRSKPAGFVFVEDGKQIRNDGVEVQPAETNPWYVLATVHRPQDRFGIDSDLAARNRRIWNGWACAKLTEEERAELAREMKLEPDELAPLSEEEEALVRDAFRERLGDDVEVPDSGESIDLSATHFSHTVVWEKCVFTDPALFQSATFTSIAYFHSATFTGPALFHSATFTGPALFQSATFTDFADFRSATFTDPAYFQSATFTDSADFRSATFTDFADFRSATFTRIAYFRSATFTGIADFSDGAFRARTSFKDARFETRVPLFYQRALHQDTAFTTEDDNWPAITKDNADEGKRAYTRLRQLMNELHKPDDEHFFFRQEMKCDAVLKQGWDRRIVQWFGWASDYGYGVTRPTGILIALLVLPALIYGWYFGPGCFEGYAISPPGCMAETGWSLGKGFGFSFANLFAFLGLNRIHFADVWSVLPRGLGFLASVQTVLGFVFLFFLGLGLRNRFRLK